MPLLNFPRDQLKNHYSIVIIGSGYGGSIMASRMARAGQDVCLLERGKEFAVGDYPNDEIGFLKNLQIDGLNGLKGNKTGLYRFFVDTEMSAFVGCGLGGTSLVNANVSLRAEKRVFDDPCWPKDFINDDLLEKSYQHAESMLKPTPYPNDFPVLSKMQMLEKSATALGEKFYRPPINVNFQEGINHVGIQQHPCQLCGDCVSGCNYAAKNTLIMNYLPDAKNFGASIFTEMDVRYLEKSNNGWIIYYYDLSKESEANLLRFMRADFVVLSAGSFGSTDILLRSKKNGLMISDKIGTHFTGNGDVLAFSYNNSEPCYGIGYGRNSPKGKPPVGPCISGIIDMREKPNLEEGMVVEEGSIPGGMASLLPKIFALSAKFVGVGSTGANELKQNQQEIDSLIQGAYSGATNNTQTFLVMSHDDGQGQLILENDALQIRWPGVGSQAIFSKINKVLTAVAEPLRGTFIPNPVWSTATEHTLVTVHPLGGCIMAENALTGVVNHKGQVFSGSTDSTVYKNLYVCDGSIIPRSLGVNPLLTISALAERSAALIAKDYSWEINYMLPSTSKNKVPTKAIGLTFTETMRGRLSLGNVQNYEEAYNAKGASSCEFTLTVVTQDLDKMLTTPEHIAKITGTVTFPIISKMPLEVVDGTFELFLNDLEEVNTRKMIYQLELMSVEGNRYEFEGYKRIHNDPGIDIWTDTTTLFVTLYEMKESKKEMAKGILKILTADFMKQLTTIRVLNTDDNIQALKAKARFGQFFAGTLYDIYGGVVQKTAFFDSKLPPREKRTLRVSAPEVFYIMTEDKQQLRLTRYKGGNKGPVILLHGLGVSSLIFSIDTIETNLLEYLFEHQYDVWLLDNRASIDLPAAKTAFTADDIATYDYDVAIKKVLEVSTAKDVQMVAHCFGASTLCMAMLSGLKNVRSILFSQIAAHAVTGKSTEIKSGLYLPTFLKKMGVNSLTAYADADEDWQQKLFDNFLKITNSLEEPCDNPVCRRISFLYGPLYEHSQLNQKTHDYLHEMFGVANINSFEQLALITRVGHIVTATGEEKYLPNVNRLALPITFIHGENNRCFLPKSTELTFNLLKEKNGDSFYQRHVIPGYGHIDCIFGKNASKDVYPFILHHLER